MKTLLLQINPDVKFKRALKKPFAMEYGFEGATWAIRIAVNQQRITQTIV